MKPTVSRALRLGISLLILVFLVIFATKVNWHQIGRGIRDASRPMLLAAALVNIASILVKAVRWWVFLRPIGATSPWLALRATFAGAGLNNVLVANGGEAARVVFVSPSAHITTARVLATLLAVNIGFGLRATPGNVGVFQAAYAAAAVAFGLDRNEAIAVAFLIQAQQILPVTALGIALAPEFIFKAQKRRRDDAAGEIPSESRGEHVTAPVD